MINPLSLALIPAVVGLFAAVAAVPVTLTGRYLLRRARRQNREGKCGACGVYLPFSADPNAMFLLAGTYVCARCARRGRRFLNMAARTVPLTLLAFGSITIVAILNSGLPLSWWVGGRLFFALLPSVGAALGFGLMARALKQANEDPVVPAYDSVMEGLKTERQRRENLALPSA